MCTTLKRCSPMYTCIVWWLYCHMINALNCQFMEQMVHDYLHIKIYIFTYLGFYVAFNTVQVISRWAVRMAEETSTHSWSRFCTLNYRPTVSNYQLPHLRPCREPNPGLRGRRQECYHSATVAPQNLYRTSLYHPVMGPTKSPQNYIYSHE